MKFPPGRPKSCRRWGPLSGRERILSALVLLAITLWMLGGAYVEATTAALIVISLMLTMRVVSWKEMAGNHTAWTTGPHERHDAGDAGGRPTGVPADKLALALALTTGIMGVITPHATGPACWHGNQHCRAARYTVAGKAE